MKNRYKNRKFCIFCGKPPEAKTNEHILPRWLLKLTGNPNRIVNIGRNPVTGRVLKFSWESFQFPACLKCNNRYSKLEELAEPTINNILGSHPARAVDYIGLLDWLDKVRIGLWFAFYYLFENPTLISPKFHINTRIGKKDRMLAVYKLDFNEKGLNFPGAESVCFQRMPSCFSLRINDIILYNMSWDFMCSRRCGFPYPKRIVADLDDGGNIKCYDFTSHTRVASPLLGTRLVKPCVQLYQPIISKPINREEIPRVKSSKIRLAADATNKNVLFRELDNSVQVILNPNEVIKEDKAVRYDTRGIGEILSQTYNFQLNSFRGFRPISRDRGQLTQHKLMVTFLKLENIAYRKVLKEGRLRLG